MLPEKGELCKKSSTSIVAWKIGQIKLQAGTSLQDVPALLYPFPLHDIAPQFYVVLTGIHSLQPTLTGYLSSSVGCTKPRRHWRERLFNYPAIGLLLCDLYHFSLRLRAMLTK